MDKRLCVKELLLCLLGHLLNFASALRFQSFLRFSSQNLFLCHPRYFRLTRTGLGLRLDGLDNFPSLCSFLSNSTTLLSNGYFLLRHFLISTLGLRFLLLESGFLYLQEPQLFHWR